MRDFYLEASKWPGEASLLFVIVTSLCFPSLYVYEKWTNAVDIIEELIFEDEKYIVLKTNLQISTSFPKYLRKLLPREVKPVIADKYNPRLAELFKDVRDKGFNKTSTAKIDRFLGDLSSVEKKKDSIKK